MDWRYPQKKSLHVSWKKTCSPFVKGGLNIHSLVKLNEATNLRILWQMRTTKKDWAILLQNRVLKSNGVIKYHIFSSIWTGIKAEASVLDNHSRWSLGNGRDIHFFNDTWCECPLILDTSIEFLRSKGIMVNLFVADFIFNRQWSFPTYWDFWFLFCMLCFLLFLITLFCCKIN